MKTATKLGYTLFIAFGLFTGQTLASPDGLTILSKHDIEEATLPESEPFPAEVYLSGSTKNWLSVPFGGEFTIMIWEAEAAKIAMREGHAYDQYVEVLSGELVMTDTDGESATFKPGDRFVMQKGFKGTWHMTEDYRELIIVETKALVEAEGTN